MRMITKCMNIIEPASRACVFIFFGYNIAKGCVGFLDAIAVLVCVFTTITEIRKNYEAQIRS